MRTVAEQHAVGGGERQRVAGRLFPGEVLGPLHQLARLDAAELGEGAVRRFVAPDALAGREHRVAAIAFLVVAVVLVAVDDDFVAGLPALHALADRPDDAGGVGAGDMEGRLVDVEGGNGFAEAGPDAVIVDAGRHHEDEHFVGGDLRGRDDFELHGGLGTAMAFAPDRPGVHGLRNVEFRRDLADCVEVLHFARTNAVSHVVSPRAPDFRPFFGSDSAHAKPRGLSSGRHIVQGPDGLQAILLHCNREARRCGGDVSRPRRVAARPSRPDAREVMPRRGRWPASAPSAPRGRHRTIATPTADRTPPAAA